MHDTDRDTMSPQSPTASSPRHGAHEVGHDAHHGAVEAPGGTRALRRGAPGDAYYGPWDPPRGA